MSKYKTNGTKEDEFIEECKKGSLEKIKKFIEEDKVKPDIVDEDERTGLHWAAAGGHLAIVQYLVNQCNQSVNTIDDGGWSPLLSATSSGHINMVKVLLEFGANPNDTNDTKKSPLHYASSKNRVDIVDLLLDYGAKSFKDSNGMAPIHRAAAIGSVEVIKRLLTKAKVNIDSQDSQGDTAAHIAAESNYENVIELLLENNADMTIENSDHKTPIDITSSQTIKYIIKEWKK
ncbi:ankyrin repeat-containing protein [Tieghemostelium lacteum]|uniref:Ankyrin repeat-containing protein n=1 Tax=Tieghemostelium lacteum TaxID=361077 RepID=A0A151Z6U2_TIELA|nr:ankyrin repeat-containing protein [Tieghemostelium lacteum]|eukprot:KYQ89680.1 ankyrin repeat-containing protein [Tieghemostelium lacteum]